MVIASRHPVARPSIRLAPWRFHPFTRRFHQPPSAPLFQPSRVHSLIDFKSSNRILSRTSRAKGFDNHPLVRLNDRPAFETAYRRDIGVQILGILQTAPSFPPYFSPFSFSPDPALYSDGNSLKYRLRRRLAPTDCEFCEYRETRVAKLCNNVEIRVVERVCVSTRVENEGRAFVLTGDGDRLAMEYSCTSL